MRIINVIIEVKTDAVGNTGFYGIAAVKRSTADGIVAECREAGVRNMQVLYKKKNGQSAIIIPQQVLLREVIWGACPVMTYLGKYDINTGVFDANANQPILIAEILSGSKPVDIVGSQPAEKQEEKPKEEKQEEKQAEEQEGEQEEDGMELLRVIGSDEKSIVWANPLAPVEYDDILLENELGFLNPLYMTIIRAPSGTAKTTSLYRWGWKNGYEVYVSHCSPDMERADFLGHYTIVNGDTIYVASPLMTAMYRSAEHKVLFIFDEVNLVQPIIMKSLGDALDVTHQLTDTVAGNIRANSDNIVFAGTMNSEVDSTGYELDVSTISRSIVIDVDINEIAKRLKSKVGKFANIFVETQGKLSIRDIEQMSYLLKEKKMEFFAALDIVLNKYDKEFKKQVRDIINRGGEGISAGGN